MKKLIFYSHFNRANFTPRSKTTAWINARFAFCKRWTMQSILHQKNPAWELWLLCDINTKVLIEPLRPQLPDPRIKIVYYPEPFLTDYNSITGFDHVLTCRIDSDDLYHPDVADILLNAPVTGKRFMQFNSGYFYNTLTDTLCSWVQTSSPFYCRTLKGGEKWQGELNHAKVCGQSDKMAPGKFMVLFHNLNTSTTARAAPIKNRITGTQRTNIMREFNI
jgi:hypothetical protein